MQRHHKKHRHIENLPNGFLEEWHGSYQKKPDVAFKPDIPTEATSDNHFDPVSIILTTNGNNLLTSENDYRISFSAGMNYGKSSKNHIAVNTSGDVITFAQNGSYRFEIWGDATPFSETVVTLTYSSNNKPFPEAMSTFNQIVVTKEGGKIELKGIPTILPIKKSQNISVRLVPHPQDNIVVLDGLRVLIQRVA